MAQLPKYEVSPQEGVALMSDAMVKWWLGALGTLTHVMGTENAMKAYGPVMRQIGKEKMEEMNQKLNITSEDAIALGSVVNLWEDMMGIQGRVEEATPDRVVKVNTACPFSKAPHEACRSLECAIAGMRDVLSPEYKFVATHVMTRGDPYCRWVVEKK
jgi:predicted ArsR family transcriptional regulator